MVNRLDFETSGLILALKKNDEYEEWLKESHKSSWALEKTPYVIKTLLSQGAPAKTVSDFLSFINKKDTEKAKEGLQAYLDELTKCKLTARGYSKNLRNSFNKLARMIYPINVTKNGNKAKK